MFNIPRENSPSTKSDNDDDDYYYYYYYYYNNNNNNHIIIIMLSKQKRVCLTPSPSTCTSQPTPMHDPPLLFHSNI